jgi:hypothetical protein
MAVLVDVAAAVRSDKPSRQVLACQAGVMVLLGVVDEVLPREEAALGAARCQCLWHTGQHAGILACQYLIAIRAGRAGSQAADKELRGATMGLHSICGYAVGFIGPLGVGLVLDWTGSAQAWRSTISP